MFRWSWWFLIGGPVSYSERGSKTAVAMILRPKIDYKLAPRLSKFKPELDPICDRCESESDVTRVFGICTLHLTYPKCTHTRSSGQPFMLRRPGSSWGFGALLKGTSVHWPTYNSCWTWDSNLQPLGYKSNSLTIRPMKIGNVGHQKAHWFWSWLLWELCFIDCCTIDNKQWIFPPKCH